MKTTLAIVWLVTLIHMMIIGITSGYAEQCKQEINTFIMSSQSH